MGIYIKKPADEKHVSTGIVGLDTETELVGAFASVNYSQLEMRMVADLNKNLPELERAFKKAKKAMKAFGTGRVTSYSPRLQFTPLKRK